MRRPVKVWAIDADKMKFRYHERTGHSGFGLSDEGVGYTVNTVDRHIIAYVNKTIQSGDGERAK